MNDEDAASAEKVRLLLVCTGNVCRSPYAQLLLGDGLERIRPGRFEISSAGTHALVGEPMDEGSARLLDSLGLANQDFLGRLMTPELVGRQDLVLGMTRAHLAFVGASSPSMQRRSMTLLGLSRDLERVADRRDWTQIMQDAGADTVRRRWRVLPQVLQVHSRRPRWRKNIDVQDPYRRGVKAFDRMALQVAPAVRVIVDWEGQFPT